MPKTEPTLNVRKYNRYAWDRQVDKKNPFTIPVSSEVIAAARRGKRDSPAAARLRRKRRYRGTPHNGEAG